MGILRTLKAILGIGGRRRDRDRGTRVAVTEEPATESERAVKESPPEPEPAPGSPPAETAPSTSPPTAEPDVAGSDEPVNSIKGIGDAYAERLGNAGIETVADLATADPAEVSAATDIAEGRLEGWIEQARER